MALAARNIEILPIAESRDLLDPHGGFRVHRICEALGVEPAEFARLSGRSTESVAKLFKKESVQPRSEKTRSALAGAAALPPDRNGGAATASAASLSDSLSSPSDFSRRLSAGSRRRGPARSRSPRCRWCRFAPR